MKIIGIDFIPEKCNVPIKKQSELTRGFKMKRSLELNILFATGKYHVHKLFHPQIDEIVSALKQFPANSAIVIEGHTDHMGTDRDNLKLSLERAQDVKKELQQRGVNSVYVCPYGERVPKTFNDTIEGQATNRRVEVRLGKIYLLVKGVYC